MTVPRINQAVLFPFQIIKAKMALHNWISLGGRTEIQVTATATSAGARIPNDECRNREMKDLLPGPMRRLRTQEEGEGTGIGKMSIIIVVVTTAILIMTNNAMEVKILVMVIDGAWKNEDGTMTDGQHPHQEDMTIGEVIVTTRTDITSTVDTTRIDV